MQLNTLIKKLEDAHGKWKRDNDKEPHVWELTDMTDNREWEIVLCERPVQTEYGKKTKATQTVKLGKVTP